MKASLTVLNEHIALITSIPEVTVISIASVYTHATQLSLEYSSRLRLLKLLDEIPYKACNTNSMLVLTNLLNKEHIFIKGKESSIYWRIQHERYKIYQMLKITG